jgi:coenzyme F420 biosynthesis associated uncharacterized protein
MQFVDWGVATATATRLVPPGPRLELAEATAIVDDLRRLATEAEQHVSSYTGLPSGEEGVGFAVVDRPGWIRSNVAGFADLVDPLLDSVLSKKLHSVGPVMSMIGPRATGVEVGALLAYLATRVLGQFELFGPPPADGTQGGRLTLVAPNIVIAERALGVDPHDFRLWVVLHEVTHRTQFTAVAWLRGYFHDQVRAYVDATDLDPGVLLDRLRDAASAVRGAVTGDDSTSLLDALQTPAQREIVGRLQALMSLLEGHGDYVMDGVGPKVVPTAETIRERFDERRKGSGPVDRVIRRLFGLDMKMRQYAEGEKFVRHVVDAVGMDGFNRVWTSPETLPTQDEIADPATWVSRVATPAKPRRTRKKVAEDGGA